MNRLTIAFASILGVALAACSGAPSGDGGPDYEVDITGKKTAPPSGEPTSDPPSEDNPDTSPTPPPPSSSSSSSSGGTPAAKPTVVTLTIDGTAFTVDDTTLWADVSKAGTYDVFVKITGPGAGAGSDFHVTARETGDGCDNTSNYLTYRPAGDSQYMPKGPVDAACGLTVTSLPKAVGDRFTGTFKAKLYAINSPTPKSKNVELSFDVLRAK